MALKILDTIVRLAPQRQKPLSFRAMNLKKTTEHHEQVLIFKWATYYEKKYPALKYMFSTLNGVRLTIGQAKKAKAAGNKKGVPDIVLPFKNKNHNGLFIELKIPGGKTSKEQKEYLFFLRAQGYYSDIRVGSREAIDLIVDYLNDLI